MSSIITQYLGLRQVQSATINLQASHRAGHRVGARFHWQDACCPSLWACLQELHTRLQEKHLEKCINAAHTLQEENAAAQAAPTAAQQDVFKAMMQLEEAN